MTTDLPQFARDLLSSCPPSGSGVHRWLFRVARVLWAYYPDASEIAQALEAASSGCGRRIPMREIVAAVKDSQSCAYHPRKPGESWKPSAPKWPTVNQDLVATITQDGPGLADLWELSPIRFEDNQSHSEEVIDSLFPANPLLCCGKTAFDFNTRPREEWRGQLSNLQFIVPSPMTSRTGRTKEGKESSHSLDNTADRAHIVVEFDSGDYDQHAAIACHLAKFAPPVLCVMSGGKSLHSWFRCGDQPEAKILRFFHYAVSLGADPATWTKSQFVRMPDGTRNTGKRQSVLYFRP